MDQPPPFPLLPWKSLVTIKIMNLGTAMATRQNGTVNRTLLGILSYAHRVRPTPIPVDGLSSRDVTVDPDRNLWFRLFTPATEPGSSSLPVIVFFHGGGFAYLSADMRPYDDVCRRFAREIGAVVVSVNYRLAPEHRYPAQFDDGFDVLKFLDGDKGQILLPENAELAHCFLAGDSAGANLAHHVAKRACNSDELKHLRVIGLAAIQPFFGGNERTEAEVKLSKVDPLVSVSRTDWLWKAFMPAGEGGDRDHEVINVSGPRAVDISKLNFPATMVVLAGFDSLKDWQRRYYQWLNKSGKEAYLVEYPTMVHAFYIFPRLKESADLVAKVKDFVTHQCSNNLSPNTTKGFFT